MALVTLAQAKRQLRIEGDSENDVVYLKVAHAEDIVLDYLKSQADETWTSETVPGGVREAILMVLTHLYEHRGDDMKTDGSLWEAIGRILARRRDPALA